MPTMTQWRGFALFLFCTALILAYMMCVMALPFPGKVFYCTGGLLSIACFVSIIVLIWKEGSHAKVG